MYNVALVIARLFDAYSLLIVVWCVLSWFPRRPGSWVEVASDAIGTLVEPYLRLFRRILPPMGGIDFSPVVAILVLELLERVVLRIIV